VVYSVVFGYRILMFLYILIVVMLYAWRVVNSAPSPASDRTCWIAFDISLSAILDYCLSLMADHSRSLSLRMLPYKRGT
jgi:hypothetical protein